MAYCTRQDLIDRLSETGLLFVTDDDADEAASERERTASLDRAIVAAGVEIDAALLPHSDVPVTASNDWLTQRAIDLAIEHIAERKGSIVPASLAEAARRSRTWLDQVHRAQLRVPGLVYPADRFPDAVRRAGLPRLCNPDAPRH